MSSKKLTYKQRVLLNVSKLWSKRWFRRTVYGFIGIVVIPMLIMFVLGEYYIISNRHKSMDYGVSFSTGQAKWLVGDDWKNNYLALLNDLHVKRVRLMSYWDDIEPKQSDFHWEDLDWQMNEAAKRGIKVSLAIGARQPRWPECHIPKWVGEQGSPEFDLALTRFLRMTVERYKDNPSLESYQLENKYFLKIFSAECKDYRRSRLVDEFNLVRQLDPKHQIIVTLSNNFLGSPVQKPTPDKYGFSIYKKVFLDRWGFNMYIEYPIPAWYYGFRAWFLETTKHRPVIVHELQAEPWGPTGIKEMSIDEQDKSMNAGRFKDRMKYIRGTGIKTIDLWGGEWWYYRKTVLHDPSVWDAVKAELNR